MRSWTDQEERHKHIKLSTRKRGKSESRGKQFTADKVKRQRRTRGNTPNKTAERAGNSNRPPAGRTTDELYNIALEYQRSQQKEKGEI